MVSARTPLPSRRALVGGCLAGALGLAGCARTTGAGRADAEPVTGSTFAFDTYCTFTVYGDDAAPAKLARACARYDALFDLYDEDSDIARVNAAGGAPVRVDPDTVALVSRGLELSAESDGRFDITIGAVSTLWDFAAGVRPTDSSIADALGHVDWRAVHVDEDASTIRLDDAEAKLDLGGIAKGFIADRLLELLETETDAVAAVLSLGGNVAFFGTKPDGGPWDAGVRDVDDPGGSRILGTAHIDGGSLVTSGLYERTFELDGETYWHILDPRTGMPVETDVASVTVLCPSSTVADALSTTLFIAGSFEGARIAARHDGTEAYFVLRDGSSAETPGWQDATGFTAEP